MFYNGNIIEARDLIDSIEDKNESTYYLSYQIYMKLDDLNNANKFLQKAIELNEEKYIDEGHELGQLINDLKNVNKTLTSGFVNEAIDEAAVLIKKYENNSICYYRLGFAYKENKDYDNAVINFNKAKQLNPYNSLYQDEITNISNIELLKGKEYYDMKDYQTALESFKKVFDFPNDKKEDDAQLKLGICYIKLEDNSKAKKELQNYVDQYPRGEFVAKAKSYLTQLD